MSEDKAYGGGTSNKGSYTFSNKGTYTSGRGSYTPPKKAAPTKSKPKPKGTFTYNRPAGITGSADVMERRIQANKAGKPLYGRDQGYPERPWWEDLPVGGGGGGGGEVATYSPEQIAATQASLAANRARMESLYKRYAEDIASREADIEGLYTGSATNLGGIYDTSVANINKAYEAARAAQTQQLLNLGMTEQTPVQSFGNQTESATSLNNLRAAVLAQNEASRKAAITNQRLAAEGATRQGVGELTAYDRQVAQAIAEMQAARTSVGGGGGGGGGLTPYQAANLRMQGEQNEFNRQKAAQEFALKSQPQARPNLQAALDFAAKANLTPDQIRAAQLYLGTE
jgi:hypothetical protein